MRTTTLRKRLTVLVAAGTMAAGLGLASAATAGPAGAGALPTTAHDATVTVVHGIPGAGGVPVDIYVDGTVDPNLSGLTFGQVSPPQSLAPGTYTLIAYADGYSHLRIEDVVVSPDHSLTLRDDGSVVAWGKNVHGQTDVPASATNVVAISAGWAHSVALRADGTVVAWGSLGGKMALASRMSQWVCQMFRASRAAKIMTWPWHNLLRPAFCVSHNRWGFIPVAWLYLFLS